MVYLFKGITGFVYWWGYMLLFAAYPRDPAGFFGWDPEWQPGFSAISWALGWLLQLLAWCILDAMLAITWRVRDFVSSIFLVLRLLGHSLTIGLVVWLVWGLAGWTTRAA